MLLGIQSSGLVLDEFTVNPLAVIYWLSEWGHASSNWNKRSYGWEEKARCGKVEFSCIRGIYRISLGEAGKLQGKPS